MLTRKRYYYFVHFVSVNLTSYTKLSINTIDKFRKVCYTRIKLENKTKNLTNNKNKQRKTKMSYETYKNEIGYSSKNASNLTVRLGHAAVFSKDDVL